MAFLTHPALRCPLDAMPLVLEDGSLICPDCTPKCPVCSKELSGSIVNVEGENLHADCFRCTSCKGEIADGYFKDPTHTETNHGDTRVPMLCNACYGSAMQDLENSEHKRDAVKEKRETAKQEKAAACVWDDRYKGHDEEGLGLLGVALHPEVDLQRKAGGDNAMCLRYTREHGLTLQEAKNDTLFCASRDNVFHTVVKGARGISDTL